MTAKEKAEELVDKYFWKAVKTKDQAIRCAKITVDEIIKEFEYNSKHDQKNGYWQEVKQELEKM